MGSYASIKNHPLFREDLRQILSADIDWDRIEGSTFLITGATGMIGSLLAEVLLCRGAKVIAVGRDVRKAEDRFPEYLETDRFQFVPCDIAAYHPQDIRADYIIHAASNTHPVAYATDPVGTITTNVFGLYNLLTFARDTGVRRFLFLSSVEIYGENRGDAELFDESYCGYIDCNTMRAGYPESKRLGETLCQAFLAQNDLDIVIPRLSRSYGPGLLNTDTKALSQFIHKAVSGEDIILKSRGTQQYSYIYAADAVSGLLTVLDRGEKGQAYNISDEKSNIQLKDLAEIIAGCAGRKVVFELPDETEQAGYSKATKAMLDNGRLRGLGWTAIYDIASGVERTIRILKDAST